MSEKYTRLYKEHRATIANMHQAKFTQAEIGEAIGFSQSTVSKGLSRNKEALCPERIKT